MHSYLLRTALAFLAILLYAAPSHAQDADEASCEELAVSQAEPPMDDSAADTWKAWWNARVDAGGGTDYRALGDVVLWVFPDRRVERVWKGKAPSRQMMRKQDEETWKSTFGGPAHVAARYNPQARKDTHIFALTKRGSYLNKTFEQQVVDG